MKFKSTPKFIFEPNDYPFKNSYRNKQCLCDSGKKFKLCCFNKTAMINNEDIKKIFKDSKKTIKCSVPESLMKDCKGKKCSAHSIAKEANLRVISDKGEVYGIKTDIFNKEGIFIEKIGINKASTFNGFCSYHDSSLFKEIDSGSYSSSRKEAYLLFYRAFCRELYAKEHLISGIKEIIKKVFQSKRKFFKDRLRFEKTILKDLLLEKEELDKFLINNGKRSINPIF